MSNPSSDASATPLVENTPEKNACLRVLAGIVQLKGDPTPREFVAFLDSLHPFEPLPPTLSPEVLLSQRPVVTEHLAAVTTPAVQQQLYRCAHHILQSQGIDPAEAEVLKTLETAFQLEPEIAAALAKQPLTPAENGPLGNSALSGIAAWIRREGDARRLIVDYTLGAALVGLVPLNGGGSLEVKLAVVVGLGLKMVWDIRRLWGSPRGQGLVSVLGGLVKGLVAVLAGLLTWATVVGVGVVMPYVGALAKAAGFAVAIWMVGQATDRFYTSIRRPDLRAIKRAFPGLVGVTDAQDAHAATAPVSGPDAPEP